MNETSRTFLRLLGALLVLAGGLWHLRLRFDTYQDLPSSIPGAWVVTYGFPAQAALSCVVVILLLLVRRPIVWAVAVLVELGSVLALVLSRQVSIFGWKEPDWSGDAKIVALVELAAVLVLAGLLAADFHRLEAEDDLATY